MVSSTRAVASALSLAGGDAAKFAGALQNLSPTMISHLVASGQLTQEQIKSAIATDVLTEKEKEAIQTQVLHTGTTTGAAGATKLFDFSLKGLLATMKALAVAHPVLTILAAIAALAGGIAIAVDAATTSIDEHNERIVELESEGRELQSELDSLNQELDTFADRLDELRNKKVAGTLNLVEKSELEDLERRNQLLLQYKELIQDDVDKNTREKLDEANEVFQSRYHASSISVSSAGVAVEGALQSREAEETLLYYTAETKRISELMADARSQLAQGGLSENDTRILEQNIRVYQKWIDDAKADVQDIVDDLSPSVKSVIDTGVTSGAEYDKAKAILDAVAQWQLVDATVSEKIAYLAKSAPQILQQIVAKTDGVLTEAKVAASESLQDFVTLAIQLGVIPDDSAESLAALTAAIADVGKTAASSGSEVKTFESIVSSLSEDVGALSSAQEDMEEKGYLSADSVKALKEAGLDKYLVATRQGYQLARGALNNYIEAQKVEKRNALNTAKAAAEQIIENEEGKTKAYNRTTKALISQIQAQQSEKLIQMSQLEAQFLSDNGLTKSEGSRVLNDGYIDQYTSETKRKYTNLRNSFLNDQKILQDLITASKEWDLTEIAINTVLRDYDDPNPTDTNKSKFEEEYAKQKHALELGKKTLKEFNDWLDGEEGYKQYFSDLETYATEWRKYEKEVFDNSMELHDQELSDIDHKIEMLKLQNASEQEILETYRKREKLLQNARDLIYDFLKGQGLTEEQIASNSTLQEIERSILENRNDATNFHKERVDAQVSDFEHEINMLERLEGKENELIAKYREEQAYLVAVREEYRKTLVAAGKTADEIAKDDWFQELTEQIHDINDSIDDVFQDVFDRISGDLNELLDLTKELVQHEKEEQVEALEDQKDVFSDLIDAKKEMLRLTREEQEYNNKVAKSTKDIAKLQSRIDELKLDDSRQATLERSKLEEELAELQKELADTQNDHYISKTEEALDKEEEEYHDLMDAKIKEIEDFLDDNEAMTNAALQRLDGANETLFAQLESYAKHYTDTTGAELQSMWDTAMRAAEKYGSFTNSLTMFEESDVQTETQRIIAKMQHNGDMWAANPDPVSRQHYSDANLVLGEQLQDLLGVKVERIDGTWYIGEGSNRKKLYDVFSYHTGGVVGNTGSVSPKSDELFALLQRDEVVMSRQMVDNAHSFLTGLPKVAASIWQTPLSWASNTIQKAKEYVLNISAPLNMEGVLPTEEILSTIKQYPRKVAEVVAAEIQKL